MWLIIFLLSQKKSFDEMDLEILGVAIVEATKELKDKKDDDWEQFVLSLKRINILLSDVYNNTHLDELRKKAKQRKYINNRTIEELENFKKPKPSEPEPDIMDF